MIDTTKSLRLLAAATALTAFATPAVVFAQAETPAAENRVGPIVEAYRASTAKALGELTTWLEASAPPPASKPAATTTTTTQSTSTTTTTVQPAR